MSDRLSLSLKNNWCDENSNVYLIFIRQRSTRKIMPIK
ncbi:MAG: hypothetical protein HFJ20_05390 [Clostridia bacterium]|nr:hypothetical protein [Clostridia bacterium]